MSDREEVLKVAERVKEEVGDVTILINNAGVMLCHNFQSYTADEIKRNFEINVLAHFWVSRKDRGSLKRRSLGFPSALERAAM